MPPQAPTGLSSQLHLNFVRLQVFIPGHSCEKPEDFSEGGPTVLGLKRGGATSTLRA